MDYAPDREIRRWLVDEDGEKTPMPEPGFCVPLSSGCWVSVELSGPWHKGFSVDVCVRVERSRLDAVALPALAVLPYCGNHAGVRVGTGQSESAERLDIFLADSPVFRGASASGGPLPRNLGDAVQAREFLVEYGDIGSVEVAIVETESALFDLSIKAVSSGAREASESYLGLYMLLNIGASNVLHFWFSEVEFKRAE